MSNPGLLRELSFLEEFVGYLTLLVIASSLETLYWFR